MSEKEFLEAFIEHHFQKYMNRGDWKFVEAQIRNEIDMFLALHHKEYYPVRFENIKEYSEKAKDCFTI